MVESTFGLTVSIAERIATRTSCAPSACPRSIAFCTISTLSSSVGAMLTAASETMSALAIGRHIHHEAVADPSRRAQSAVAGDHRAHQLVGMQAAFHQALGAAFAHQAYCLRCGRVAVRCVDDLECRNLKATLLGERRDTGHRSYQNRNDDAELRRFYGTP